MVLSPPFSFSSSLSKSNEKMSSGEKFLERALGQHLVLWNSGESFGAAGL